MAVVREITQVMDVRGNQATLSRPPHDTVIERTGEKVRENRNDVKAHSCPSYRKQTRSAVIPAMVARRDSSRAGLRGEPLRSDARRCQSECRYPARAESAARPG